MYGDDFIFFRGGFTLTNIMRQENRHAFIQKSRTYVEAESQTPSGCRISRFFLQLAFGGGKRGFTGINFPRRQLPNHPACSIAVLPLSKDTERVLGTLHGRNA